MFYYKYFSVVSLVQNKNKLVDNRMCTYKSYIHTDIMKSIALRKIYCMRDIQNVLEYFKVRIIFQARNIQSNALNMK